MADEQRSRSLAAVGQRPPVLRPERLGHGLFPLDDAVPACEIARDPNVAVAERFEQVAHGLLARSSWTSRTSGAPRSKRVERRAREQLASGPRRAAPRAAPSRAPRARARRTPSAWTYGGFETTRSNGARRQPVARTRVHKLDVEAEEIRVLARERERVGRDVGARRRARPGPRPRARARSRRCRSRRRARAGIVARATAASRAVRAQRSTTVSVSGRGTSARASHRSVSRRKPHSPSTYASGSRAARRSTRRPDRGLVDFVALSHKLGSGDAENVRDDPFGVDARASRSPCSARIARRARRRSLERAPPLLRLQRLGEVAEIAVEDLVEPVLGQLDPVVRDAVLGEVVGADLLGALAACRSASGAAPRAPPAASRARARRGARAGRASPSPCSGAATSRPASRRRRRSGHA